MASSGSDVPKVKREEVSGFSLPTRLFIGHAVLLFFFVGIACVGFIPSSLFGGLLDFQDPRLAISLMLFFGTPLAFYLSYIVSKPFLQTNEIVDMGIRSFEDGDYGIRLAPPSQPELYELVTFFNRLAELHTQERGNTYQKELLLDTVLQAAPMGILLLGPTDHIIIANRAAQQILQPDKPLPGLSLEILLEMASPQFREVLQQKRDSLFTLSQDGETETYHVSQRQFNLNTLSHQLIMVKRLTRELRRQEVATWKKLIRLLNHELNNTLAPIQSLLHSARTIVKTKERYHQLDRIFSTMESTTRHLQRFLEDYASFARLPLPRKAQVDLRQFLIELKALIPFEFEGEFTGFKGYFDPGQIQRVLINLVKNGREASGENPEITIGIVDNRERGLVLQVRDRGRGMSQEAMQKALLPFYSTKKSGTGLGLPLCREIMESHGGTLRLQGREGGGIAVTCWFPAE